MTPHKAGSGRHLATLDLLRAVYVASLRDGRARTGSISKALGEPVSSVGSTLKEASAKRLVRVTKGSAELTPAELRQLEEISLKLARNST